ncbi:MAG TPA: Smr/MutS family protein [Methylomirabilota bacterium]|nr:Smr/MutS family protein [Methylomirabilota bacterium]
MTRGDLLGWTSFRDLLARFTATAPGRDRALTLDPHRDLAAVQAALTETTEARGARRAEGPPPWPVAADVRPILAEAAPAGAVLDGPALAALGAMLAGAARLAVYGARIAGVAPGLAATWAALPTCPALAETLRRALDPDGRLTDEASPRLRALRRQLGRHRAELRSRLERLLEQPALAPALQDRYVTVRNQRYVVPVRDDARRAVRGIIHDRSQSGATVFVEPEEMIPLNNELTRLTLEERDEERRLLAALTDAVRGNGPALAALIDGLGRLDLVFARAALAERLDASEPEVGPGGDLELREARHPLLVAQRWAAEPPGAATPVVPVDLRLPADRPGLVISGPNAGGKTVALETCGLLVLMAQAGCHLPAAPGSRVPLCDRVLAVIGDEQSLARDLSTFSSFVAQVNDILAVARPGVLVLLDELGAGTDPAEGAAIGAAILEAFLDRGARVVATTHLDPLKVFAQVEPRLQNATVAFDADRLEPTFRLEYGRPGPSHALAIAARLGMPPAVVDRARAHVGEQSRRLETLLATLEARVRDTDARAAETARREAQAAAALAEARRTAEEAGAEAARLRREAEADARALLAEARRRVGHELDRLKADEAHRRREAYAAYRNLRVAEAAAAPAPAASAGPAPAGEVQLRGVGLRGRVVAETDDTVTVQAGRLTVRVARSEIEPAAAGPGPAGPSVRAPVREDAPRELFLLGFTSDEARVAVDKFLDDAALAGHLEVRLVHGKGTGTLRRAVEAVLRGHPLVTAFHLAEAPAGGAGVTVARLEPAQGERAPARSGRGAPARRARR